MTDPINTQNRLRNTNLPEVNEARVDAVKQALTKGEYQPDAEVIARKYSEIEKLLP
jgi:flagellar biosynthesis anti-sigma factor FlgM